MIKAFVARTKQDCVISLRRFQKLKRKVKQMDLIDRQAAINICAIAIDLWHGQLGEGVLVAVRDKIKELPSAQPKWPETAKRIVGQSRNGITMWYECDRCGQPVDQGDCYCSSCGRRLEDGGTS